VVKYRPYALYPSSLSRELTYVSVCPPAFLSAFSTTIAPINPAVRPCPAVGSCGGRIPISSCLYDSVADIPAPSHHYALHRRSDDRRPLSSADILVPVRGVSPWQPSAATAPAECKESACSEIRLREEQGPWRCSPPQYGSPTTRADSSIRPPCIHSDARTSYCAICR